MGLSKNDPMRMVNIPVHGAIGLYMVLLGVADKRGGMAPQVTGQLLQEGLESFEAMIETRNPSDVLNEYEDMVKAHPDTQDHVWTMKSWRTYVLQARLVAKEYEYEDTNTMILILLAIAIWGPKK